MNGAALNEEFLCQANPERKGALMMLTRPVVHLILLVAGVVTLAGCGQSPDLEGTFTGPAGTLQFMSDNKIQVQFNSEFAWMAMSEENNNQILAFRFVDPQNKTAAYDKAVYVNLSKDGRLVISNPCKVTRNQVVLHPGKSYEAVFTRVEN